MLRFTPIGRLPVLNIFFVIQPKPKPFWDFVDEEMGDETCWSEACRQGGKGNCAVVSIPHPLATTFSNVHSSSSNHVSIFGYKKKAIFFYGGESKTRIL
jgi:hypothetical protein